MRLIKKGEFLRATSFGALIVATLATPFAASAQTRAESEAQVADKSDEKQDKEVIVVGVREALKKAKDVKRDADTVVDSITATDVGALPDKSIAEALQRVPGITVSRFAATGDTQHFSAEPSGVIIRGLNQVRSEFNGRDTFSADSSRGLSWEDITPELMSRIDVYKNQTADLIEGGIAGMVDLHTRVPFDFKGREIAVSGDLNYSLVSKGYNPNVSALYSNRWRTGIGDFGLMVQGAYSELDTRSEGIYLGRMGIYGPGTLAPETTYVPTFVTARDNLYNRRRKGLAAAAQWQNPSGTLLATVQYNRSDYDQTATEYSALNWVFALWGQKANYIIPADWPDGAKPLPGQSFKFGPDGSFQSGVLTSGLGWWGADETAAAAAGVNSNGIPIVNPNGCAWGATSPAYTAQYCQQPSDRRGVGMETNSRRIVQSSMTQDISFNLKWSPSSRFHGNWDVQYVDASRSGYGTAGALQSYTGLTADFSGALPNIQYTTPLNVNLVGGLSNPNSWNYAWLQDYKERSKGTSFATKLDGEYMFESDWLASLKFGARYVDRDQEVRQAYNFRGITSRWESAAYYNADKTSPIANVTYGGKQTFFAGYPDPTTVPVLQMHSFRASYMGGGVMDQSSLLYLNPDFLGNPAEVNKWFDKARLGIGDFNPICSATGFRSSEIIGSDGQSTCFTPSETLRVNEKVKAAYAMLRFGGRNAEIFNTGATLSGNIGLRFVETRSRSTGSVDFGRFTDSQLDCFVNSTGQAPPGQVAIPPSTPYSPGCYVIGAAAHNATVAAMPDMIDDGTGKMIVNPRKVILPDYITGSRDDLAFHNGAIQPVVGDKTYRNWLPSVNLKLDLGHNYIMRFAYSKAMSRPDFSLFRYAAQINQPGVDVSYSAQCKTVNQTTGAITTTPGCTPNPELTFDSQGRLTAARPRYQVNTGNPFIRPITADNFDFTVEHYWRGIGQFAANFFYKKFHDYITYGTTIVPVTNAGITRDLYIQGPVNGDGASVKGYELSFQTFLDFLPKPLDGFGVQANYTRVINSGVQNTNYDSGSGGAVDQRDFYVKTTNLEGMSDHAYNVVLFYEKGPFAVRGAYNWRSKYLVTSNDCCNLPVWQSDQGFLDGSIRYRLNPNVEINLQASNLLNGTTRLLQQVTSADDPVNPAHLVPTAWFKSDRRYSLGVRARF